MWKKNLKNHLFLYNLNKKVKKTKEQMNTRTGQLHIMRSPFYSSKTVLYHYNMILL